MKVNINVITAKNSFINNDINIENECAEPITNYQQHEIVNKGLTIYVSKSKFVQNTHCAEITCKYMLQKNSLNPINCPFYVNMKQKYQWTERNLYHLNEYVHFQDEYASKPTCRYFEECSWYKALEEGGHALNGRCHVKLYRHPPRSRNIILSENIKSLVVNKNKKENHKIYEPTIDDDEKYDFNETDGYIAALIQEVVENGYKYDLCLQCKPTAKDKKTKDMSTYCNHEQHSIIRIVENKMNSHRHKLMGSPLNRGEMLSLIVYTGCDCNYSLCKSQRDGDYHKWKWFDCILHSAITKLSVKERGSFQQIRNLHQTGFKLTFHRIITF